MTEAVSEFGNQRPESDYFRDCKDVLKSLRSFRTQRRVGRHSVDDAGLTVHLSKKYTGMRIITARLNAEGRRMLGGDTKETA